MEKISEEESSNAEKLRISSSDRGPDYRQANLKSKNSMNIDRRNKNDRVSQTERVEEK